MKEMEKRTNDHSNHNKLRRRKTTSSTSENNLKLVLNILNGHFWLRKSFWVILEGIMKNLLHCYLILIREKGEGWELKKQCKSRACKWNVQVVFACLVCAVTTCLLNGIIMWYINVVYNVVMWLLILITYKWKLLIHWLIKKQDRMAKWGD